MKTIPFDLEKARAGAKVVRGSSRLEPVVEFHCFGSPWLDYPLHAVMTSEWDNFTITGGASKNLVDPAHDLFLLVEPKLRPWKPEEVPVGAWIRNKDRRLGFWMILGVENNSIIPSWNPIARPTLEQCLDFYEHSIDHGKTWLPCGIEE